MRIDVDQVEIETLEQPEITSHYDEPLRGTLGKTEDRGNFRGLLCSTP
jgi:hypothetical protein